MHIGLCICPCAYETAADGHFFFLLPHPQRSFQPAQCGQLMFSPDYLRSNGPWISQIWVSNDITCQGACASYQGQDRTKCLLDFCMHFRLFFEAMQGSAMALMCLTACALSCPSGLLKTMYLYLCKVRWTWRSVRVYCGCSGLSIPTRAL